MPAPRIALLAPTLDLLDWAAAQIVQNHRESLPDLSGVTLLLPVASAIRPLRQKLLRHAGGALLGPQILTLATFAEQHGEEPCLSPLECQLQLAQALSGHLHLFPQQDALALAQDFYALFESLAANTAELAGDLEGFIARVARGYGAQLKLFSDEARLVHTLWRAWLQQTAGASPATAQARRLASAFERSRGALYLLGFDQFDAAQAAALRPALARAEVHLWLQGRLEGRDGAAMSAFCEQLGIHPECVAEAGERWLDLLFDRGAALGRRLQGLAPPAGLCVQRADNPEHEARLADLAIRRWLLAGKRNVAVVSQDRRYARRLRALLERAGVPLRDEAGWALSTSSAAAALMHWLECVEQGFHFRPLLALLKSHFYDPAGALADAVNALERAIYTSGASAGKKISALGEAARLLPPLQAAAAMLVLHSGSRPAREWSRNLLQSLQLLPLWPAWTDDVAGRRLAETLQELDASLARSSLRLGWQEFLRLLRRQLEQVSFIPDADEGPVRLLTLELARTQKFDALILSGAAAGQFPGGSPAQSLFNQAVRAELGLPHWEQQQQLALARFRGLLDAAPEMLISHAPENEGEEALPCAWVELLVAAGVSGDAGLAAAAGSAATDVTLQEEAAPQPQDAPHPAAIAELLPAALSASQHQALVDCPYRFHAGACLLLRAPQEPDEPYTRRDFGERVHAVLSRFTAPVNQSQRAETETRMAEAATEIFGPDLRARALTRAWLAEFESLIPEIVGWLIERRQNWPAAWAEYRLERRLEETLELFGRADRLEQNSSGQSSVVDYKTGEAPRKKDMESGEQVQATHYALLAEACVRVEYLTLKRDEFRSVVVEGAELDSARSGVRARVIQVLRALQAQAPLPAHGDARTCERCDYSGLCRKGAWANG